MSPVLVFGRNGQVASALKSHFPQARFLGASDCDFSRPYQVRAALDEHRPSLILNPAAYTAVDKAETDQENARRINAEAPATIAEWCSKHDASLVHYSTDYVYSGAGTRAWVETDQGNPPNLYGVTKLAGDEAIRASGCHHYILRTSWVFGGVGTNFVQTMRRLALTRERLTVVDDQTGSPTYAADLAAVTARLCAHGDFRERGGVYHVTNSGLTTWFGFATEIFAQLRAAGVELVVRDVDPIPTSAFPTPARRPHNSRLSLERLAADFGIRPRDWREALAEYLRVLKS